MVACVLSLLLTAAYIAVAIINAETAQTVGPVYLAVLLALWILGPKPTWRRHA